MKGTFALLIISIIVASCGPALSSQFNAESTGVNVTVVHLEDGGWRIGYEFDRPVAGFLLMAAMVDVGLIEKINLTAEEGEPELHFRKVTIDNQEFKVIANDSGKTFRKFELSFPTYNAPDLWFQLFRKFSTGISLFSGYFQGSIISLENEVASGMDEVLPQFKAIPAQGEKVVGIGGESNTSIGFPTHDGSSGVYIYFGKLSLKKVAGIDYLIDPAIPDQVAEFSTELTSQTLKFFTNKYGKLGLNPVVFLNHETAEESGASGSSLKGQFIVNVHGSGFEATAENPRESLSHVIVHEIVHQWNAVEVQNKSEEESWLWEGGAELLAWEMMKDAKLVSTSRYNETIADIGQACADTLESKTLMDVINDDSKETAKYLCGHYFQILSVSLLRDANPTRSAYSLWQLLIDDAKKNNSIYTLDSYYKVLRSSLPVNLQTKVDLLREAPRTKGPDLMKLEREIYKINAKD